MVAKANFSAAAVLHGQRCSHIADLTYSVSRIQDINRISESTSSPRCSRLERLAYECAQLGTMPSMISPSLLTFKDPPQGKVKPVTQKPNRAFALGTMENQSSYACQEYSPRVEYHFYAFSVQAPRRPTMKSLHTLRILGLGMRGALHTG